MMSTRTLLLISLTTSVVCHAGDKKSLKGKKTESVPALKLELPNFGELPTGTDLKSASPQEATGLSPKEHVEPTYHVVRVLHGRRFRQTREGATPEIALLEIPLKSSITEAFSTAVRIASKERQRAPISIELSDARGSVVMKAQGELAFFGSDEAEWTVEWAPTQLRGPGDFTVVVKVAGRVVGTSPLKFAEPAK